MLGGGSSSSGRWMNDLLFFKQERRNDGKSHYEGSLLFESSV